MRVRVVPQHNIPVFVQEGLINPQGAVRAEHFKPLMEGQREAAIHVRRRIAEPQQRA